MFKKLKSLFVIEDENAAKSAPAEKAAAPKSSTSKNTAAPSSPKPSPSNPVGSTPRSAPATPPKGKPDEKFINRLLGALEEHNIEGFDYLEYKQSLQNLGNVDMDESTKFKSALAMAKTMGATSTKLISSANHYLKVLGKEESKFLEAFKNQQTKQVSTRNAEIKKLEEGIAQRKAQIEKLKKEIASGEKALDQRKNNINQAQAKVQATKDSFYHAYHIVSQQIAADLEKMKKYLS